MCGRQDVPVSRAARGSRAADAGLHRRTLGVVQGSLVPLFLIQVLIVSTCPFAAESVNPLLSDIWFWHDISS